MKDLFIVTKFTMKDMLQRKSFIITTIIFLIMIVVGFNIPNFMKMLNKDSDVNKIEIIDSGNVFEGTLESLKDLDTGYEIQILNEDYEKIKERQRKIKVNRLFSNNDNRQESFEFSNDTKTFAEMLIFYLNIRNEKASNFYRAVNIDRRLFSKILNNDYHPSKDTVIRMCIGLRLTLNQSVDLLSRADYAFNPSKAMDLVIMRGISENKSFFEIKDDLEKAGIHIWN